MPVVRPLALACALIASTALAADPTATKAMTTATAALDRNNPGDAVTALETALPFADGDPAYLALLGQAYRDEIKKQHLARTPNEARIGELRDKLALLTERATAAKKPADKPMVDFVAQATDLFQQATAEPAKFAAAAAMFAKAMTSKVELSPQQRAAWAYCRVRLAAEQFNKSPTDPTVAASVTAEVTDALALATENAELQSFGKTLLAAAGKVAPPPTTPKAITPAVGWQLLEGENVQVRFLGDPELATAVRKAADELRHAIPTRWSGPAGGSWSPKCEIVIHPTATDFAGVTKQPAAATGHALVKLDGSKAIERRIDLRADDATILVDALPREMTHVVLADLFITAAPPRWAAEGMAVLAMSPTGIERYLRTEARLRTTGGVPSASELLGSDAPPPAERVTGFAVASVSLVEFLVRWKGERAFTTFLRDMKRYGPDAAVKRQYAAADANQLDQLWRKNVTGK